MSRTTGKFNYNETFYDEIDQRFNEWRRSVWEDSLGDVPQESMGQIGPTGWLEVLDVDGNVVVEINGNGMTWAHAETHEDGGSDEISIAGLAGIPTELANHLADALDAHDASAISVVDAGTYYAGSDVEAVLQEIGAGLAGAITDHGALAGLGDDDHPQYATNVEFDDHSARHENGGADEISVAGLSGTLADPQTPSTHATSHQNGGSDEISVAGLSGTLADPQTPTAHAASHKDGGADEVEIADLPTAETDTALVLHPDGTGGVAWGTDATGGGGGGTITVQEADATVSSAIDTIDFGAGFDVTESPAGEANVSIDLLELSAFTDHSARHEDGGADELDIEALATTATDTSYRLAPDGVGGVAFVAGGGGGIAGVDIQENGTPVSTDVDKISFGTGFDVTDDAINTRAIVSIDLSELNHNDLGGRTTATAHPASAVTVADVSGYLAATDVESAIAELHVNTRDHDHSPAGLGSSIDASDIDVLDTAGHFAATDVEAALAEAYDDFEAHLADATDAHDASAISLLDSGGFYTATDVEAAFAELHGGAPILLPSVLGGVPSRPLNLGAANRTILVPIYVPDLCTVTGVRYAVTAQSGNICVSVYNRSFARLATSGTVGCPATNPRADTNFSSSAVLTKGWYYVGLSASSTSATFGAAHDSTVGGGMAGQYSNTFPAPDPFTSSGETSNAPILFLRTASSP